MQSRKLIAPFVLSMLPLSLAHVSLAHAEPTLIAIAQIDGSYEDFATQTRTPLENGVPGNKLGGIGSGLAYAGSNTFLAMPDRGPNATPYNSAVDDTTSYIPRFHTLHLSLSPNPGGTLPFTLTPFVTGTTLLSSTTPLVYGSGQGLGLGSGVPSLNTRRTNYFSGRSDNFDATRLSSNPNNGRFDPESIRVSNDGATVFISDEYGPFVYQFERSSGKRIRAYRLPDRFGVTLQSPKGDVEISGNTQGRIANKGMEGLAISPDGRTLYGAMQSTLEQDGGTDAAYTRIVRIDVRTSSVQEIAYPLTNIGTAAKPKYGTVSDVVAINDHELLVDERDGKGLGDGSTAVVKRAYQIDVSNAADVGAIAGAANLAGKAVAKTLFLDVVAALNGAGITSDNIPAKLEGFAFGPDVEVDGTTKHTLFIANDNDYASSAAGKPNPNQFFVFAFDDGDLGAGSKGFEPQALSDDTCNDDVWQSFDHNTFENNAFEQKACDDHHH